jgi:hypothetical protein
VKTSQIIQANADSTPRGGISKMLGKVEFGRFDFNTEIEWRVIVESVGEGLSTAQERDVKTSR